MSIVIERKNTIDLFNKTEELYKWDNYLDTSLNVFNNQIFYKC